MATPEPGKKAPPITLLDQNGEKVKLTDQAVTRSLVYFYPKADTPGCTTQSCGLRDVAGDIGDTVDHRHQPRPAREAGEVRREVRPRVHRSCPTPTTPSPRRYGVWGEKKNYGKTYMGIIRSAFLIDENGKIAEAWSKICPRTRPPSS